MPVEKVKDPKTGEEKFRWGKTGKLYKRRIDAVKQGEAIKAEKSSTGMAKGGMTKTGYNKGGMAPCGASYKG